MSGYDFEDEEYFQEAFDDDPEYAPANDGEDESGYADDPDSGFGEPPEDSDDIYKSSYADRERTSAFAGTTDFSKYGIHRTREEIFIGKLSSEYSTIARNNRGIQHWIQKLPEIPNAYFLNTAVLATVFYALDNEDNPEFLPKSRATGLNRMAEIVNRATELANSQLTTGVDINPIDVYRYYKLLQNV